MGILWPSAPRPEKSTRPTRQPIPIFTIRPTERTFYAEKLDEPEKQQKTPGRENRKSDSFRDQIIRYLHEEKGISGRKAERGFRAVFDRIAETVRSGEPVELPGLGILKSVRRKGPAQRRWKPVHDIHTGKKRYLVVPDFRRPRQIIFKPFLWLEDFTPPPPPPSPEEMEARQLAAELLGRPVDASVMYCLQVEGVDPHPHQPGALLRRLQHLKKRGRGFQTFKLTDWAVAHLAQAVKDVYWL